MAIRIDADSGAGSFGDGDLDTLRECFAHFDTNGDGRIDLAELGDLARCLGHNPSAVDVEGAMRALDTNQDGFVSFDEFTAWFGSHMGTWTLPKCSWSAAESEALQTAFNEYDRDGNGVIDVQELANLANDLGQTLRQADLQRAMARLDKNGDGVLEFAEFCLWFGGQAVWQLPAGLQQQSSIAVDTTAAGGSFGSSDMDTLRECFDRFDANGDGRIDLGELGELARCLGHNATAADIEGAMRALDTNQDGFVGFDEFVAWFGSHMGTWTLPKCSWSSAESEALRTAFAEYDRDGNGVIDVQELANLANDLGQTLREADLQRAMAQLDKNGDGVLQFAEFCQWFGGQAVWQLPAGLQQQSSIMLDLSPPES